MLAGPDGPRSVLGGPSPGKVDGLLVFVDRLGAAGTDRAAARAHEQVRRAVEAGVAPPGLCRVAEGLTASGIGELPPPPRLPADDPGSVVAAVRDNPLLVLDAVEIHEIATAVAALVDDGRRVIVTGPRGEALDAVRAALPGAVGSRVVDALPTLAPADLHRLRGLLATSTPGRRARSAQALPDLDAFPDVSDVAALCAGAVRPTSPGTELVAPLLVDLDDQRREAVTAVARCVHLSLAVLGAHSEPWVWEMLGDLVQGRRRSAFEALVQSAAQALATIEDGRDDPPVRVTGPLPDDAIDLLVAYLEFRESGGRTRGPFRPSAQRDVEPLLRLLRVGDRQPATADELKVVLTHFELGERLVAVDADCAELDLPTPQNPTELQALSSALTDVGAAARSVGALRHDMLFLGAPSPVAVPDVAAAEQLALAVLDYGENGSAAQAVDHLDDLAARLAALVPAAATAPEHARAVAALRDRDAEAYAEAVDDLAGAHRELSDERRTSALLAQLGSAALVQAWLPQDGSPARFGLVWFTPTDRLLEELPAPDRADVVVVLDPGMLGMDRMLLAAAAPRIVAAVPPGGRTGSGTLLGLLNRASALVIRSHAAETPGRVVQLTPGTRTMPVREAGVEQAGA
ncbi:MAG: hypothetical protein QOK35_2836 [Pseudonocardiales bacterium]|nr:hypothetical protein [Pseudonocardiales bacterium]